MREIPEGQKVEGLTIRAYAELHEVSRSAVHRAISDGLLVVDRSMRPMRVVGGEMPLTHQRWKARLEPAVSTLKRGLYGWADCPCRLEILVGTETVSVEFSDDWRVLPRAIMQVEDCARAQHRKPMAVAA